MIECTNKFLQIQFYFVDSEQKFVFNSMYSTNVATNVADLIVLENAFTLERTIQCTHWADAHEKSKWA